MQLSFEELVLTLSKLESVPAVIDYLAKSDEPELVEVAQLISGQLFLQSEDDGEHVYYLFEEENDQGEPETYKEYVMAKGEELLAFVAWIFFAFFDTKHSDTYRAAGRTYQQKSRR